MSTPFLGALSRLTGWAADRRIPGPLRAPIYRAYARFTGADLSEVRRPLAAHASMTEFFVRHLKPGARPIASGSAELASPCDGMLLTAGSIERGTLLQAKGRAYSLAELLGSDADAAACEGGSWWTIYLSPRDYHRVHAPEDCRLVRVRRIEGTRYSVAPGVLEKRLVLPRNERAVLELETRRGTLWLVMVGALNVGRIRIAGESEAENGRARSESFGRGEELARFEMGSTVVLVAPPGTVTFGTAAAGTAASAAPVSAPVPVRLGQSIGAWARA